MQFSLKSVQDFIPTQFGPIVSLEALCSNGCALLPKGLLETWAQSWSSHPLRTAPGPMLDGALRSTGQRMAPVDAMPPGELPERPGLAQLASQDTYQLALIIWLNLRKKCQIWAQSVMLKVWSKLPEGTSA